MKTSQYFTYAKNATPRAQSVVVVGAGIAGLAVSNQVGPTTHQPDRRRISRLGVPEATGTSQRIKRRDYGAETNQE